MYYSDSHIMIGQIIATAKNADESVHSISRLTTRKNCRTWIPHCLQANRGHKRSSRRMVGTCTWDTTCRKWLLPRQCMCRQDKVRSSFFRNCFGNSPLGNSNTLFVRDFLSIFQLGIFCKKWLLPR